MSPCGAAFDGLLCVKFAFDLPGLRLPKNDFPLTAVLSFQPPSDKASVFAFSFDVTSRRDRHWTLDLGRYTSDTPHPLQVFSERRPTDGIVKLPFSGDQAAILPDDEGEVQTV